MRLGQLRMAEDLSLVMLHGWGLHGGIWQSVRSSIDLPCQVLAPDLPGYAGSAMPQPYTPDVLAHTLAQGLPGPGIICGWSMGGMVAMAWAAARPDQVRGLILVSTTPAFVQRPGWSHGLEPWVLAEFKSGLMLDYRATLLRFLALQARGGDAARAVARSLRESVFERGTPDERTLAAGLELLGMADLRERIMGIRCPTLVVHGARDLLCPAGAGGGLADSIADATLAMHPQAAHAPFLSHPAWFIEQVETFVKDIA